MIPRPLVYKLKACYPDNKLGFHNFLLNFSWRQYQLSPNFLHCQGLVALIYREKFIQWLSSANFSKIPGSQLKILTARMVRRTSSAPRTICIRRYSSKFCRPRDLAPLVCISLFCVIFPAVHNVQSFIPLMIWWLIDWFAFGFKPLLSRCTETLYDGPFVPHINLWEPCCFT